MSMRLSGLFRNLSLLGEAQNLTRNSIVNQAMHTVSISSKKGWSISSVWVALWLSVMFFTLLKSGSVLVTSVKVEIIINTIETTVIA